MKIIYSIRKTFICIKGNVQNFKGTIEVFGWIDLKVKYVISDLNELDTLILCTTDQGNIVEFVGERKKGNQLGMKEPSIQGEFD